MKYLESRFIMESKNRLMFLMELKSFLFTESNGITQHKKLQGRVKQRSKCREQKDKKDDHQRLPTPGSLWDS